MNASLVALADRALQAARSLWHEHRLTREPHGPASMAWMAPELTGRTSHIADQRSDLYALGAVFYDWATGRKPFEERDPLRMIHEQLTRTPVPPMVLRPELPAVFSAIIMRLLEKEPERRYQSAEGLAHDLQRLRRSLVRGRSDDFPLGEHDFPTQLSAPRKPVGRHAELDKLQSALNAVSKGANRAMMLSGPAGVGKTTLVDSLKPLLTSLNGRFVCGVCDPYGEDESRATSQAFASLGRLLLTEPDDELEPLRRRLLVALGSQAGAFCEALPEFKLLLGDVPAPSAREPVLDAAAFRALALSLLSVVASCERPLVMVLEDLQWSDESTLRFIEAVLGSSHLHGLLLVGTWREDEVAHEHLLEAACKQWIAQGKPIQVLHIANLGEPEIARMLCEMLRLSLPEAARLAAALGPHAGGNPRDTVEMVNALRRDGVLSPNATGWRWNIDELERHVEGTAVMDLLRSRVSRLPRAARELLEALSCLRIDASLDEAVAATGLNPRDLVARSARLAQEGVLLREPGPPPLLRLHEPIRRAAYAGLDDSRRLKLHLDFARRLNAAGVFEMEAAGQYLLAVPMMVDPRECAGVAALLHHAAGRLVALADNASARPMLEAALTLLERAVAGGEGTPALLLACELDQHLTLCRLGQFDEADEVYARIELRGPDPLVMADAACAQVGSLHHRGRTVQAVAHGLHFLRRLGFDTPENHDALEAGNAMEKLHRWVAEFDTTREFDRAEASDPRALAAANMFVRLGPTCFYARGQLAAWLVSESLSLWERSGPNQCLAVSLCLSSLVTSASGDWRTGYLASRRLVAFCEAKAWQGASLQARQLFALASSHWFEPIEQGLEHAVRAREGLLKRGDLQGACFSYRTSVVEVFECAATLDSYAQEVHAAIDLARRSGVRQAVTTFAPARQLLRALRGETAAPGSFDDAEFNEATYLANNASTPMAMVGYHVHRGLAAAIFGDTPALCVHARAALSLMTRQSFYTTAWAHWFVVLGIARELQEAPPGGSPLSAAKRIEFERSLGWLGRRAVDAPANFRHLYLHLLAERAWATGDVAVAAGYTDTSESWKLTKPRQRLAIASAGILTELALAGFATLLWCLTPDGLLRTALFFLASTSWLLTLAINASPFMRFDGYFILCDLLNLPNLHERAGGMARTWIRRTVLGLPLEWPETMTAQQRGWMIAFASATWMYRVVVFIGIASLVYLYFFKVLGILLMVVEVVWFIARPIYSEIKVWAEERKQIQPQRKWIAAMLGVAMLLILCVPWHSGVQGNGVVRAARQHLIFSPRAGALVSLPQRTQVAEGELLFALAAPDLSGSADRAGALAAARAQELVGLSGVKDGEERRAMLESERERFLAEAGVYRGEQSRMQLVAPFAGRLADVDPQLSTGVWVQSRHPLAILIDPTQWVADVYVAEEHIGRIKAGDIAKVYNGSHATRGKVLQVDTARTATLPHAMLDASYGGPIVTLPRNDERSDEHVVRDGLYRVRIALDQAPSRERMSLCTVSISGEARSLLFGVFDHALSVIVRESGF